MALQQMVVMEAMELLQQYPVLPFIIVVAAAVLHIKRLLALLAQAELVVAGQEVGI